MQTDSRYPWGKGTIRLAVDKTSNDSDKVILTCPANKIIKPLSLYVTLASDATVGNRYVQMTITDGTDVIAIARNGTALAAGGTQLTLFSFKGVYDDVTRGTEQIIGMPEMYMLEGYVMRVWDVSGVSVAGDDLSLFLQYIEYDA